MKVFVASRTSAFCENARRATVVVTAKTLRRRVRSAEGDARLFRVIEDEVVSNLVPGVSDVADRTIGREVVVGYCGSSALVPVLRFAVADWVQEISNARKGHKTESRQQPYVVPRDRPTLWPKVVRDLWH